MTSKSRFSAILVLVAMMAVIFPFAVFFQGSAVIWDPIEELSSDKKSEPQRYSAVAAEGGHTYAVWADFDGKDYDILFREHDGIAWQAEWELNTPDMNIDQWNPDVAVDGGDVHVVWHDAVDNDWDIMYRKRTGGVWGAIEEISADVLYETQFYPRVAASGGNVYAVWQDGRDGDWDIYFTFNNGVAWSTPAQVNDESGSEYQTYPCIAAGGGKAYVAWVDDGGGDTDIKMRVFDGSWGPEMEVSQDYMDQDQEEPDVTYDSGTVHVVWQEFNVTDRDIFYRSWDGTSFSAITEVSMDSATEFQNYPAVDAQFGIVHFVWADRGDGDWDILYRQYNGSTWFAPQEISADTGTEDQSLPDIATDNGVIHVVWEDFGGGDFDILYRRGNETTPGDTFPPEVQSVLLDGLNALFIPEGTPSVVLSATVDDSATGGSIIGGANYTWGPGNWPGAAMTPDDALDSSEEGFHATLDTSALGLGVYVIYVYGWDEVPNRNIMGTYATLKVVPAIYLEEGWNLVSFPHIVSDTSLSSVLETIDGDYDAVQTYNASVPNGAWALFHTSKPSGLNDVIELDNTMGFWVHVTAAGGTILVINGALPSNPHDIILYPGWNHVGYPSITGRNRTAGLNNLDFNAEVDSVWTHNATTKAWKEVGELDYFEYGMGYWLHATTACTWTVNI